MDEDSKAVIEAVASAALQPVTNVATDLLGLLGGDWLRAQREDHIRKLVEKAEMKAKARDTEFDLRTVSPNVLIEFAKGAADESRDDLLDLWAALLAQAADPNALTTVRQKYLEMLQHMDPIDARVFKARYAHGRYFAAGANTTLDDVIAAELKERRDTIAVSIESLFELKLLVNPSGGPHPGPNPALTSLGIEFGIALGLSSERT